MICLGMTDGIKSDHPTLLDHVTRTCHTVCEVKVLGGCHTKSLFEREIIVKYITVQLYSTLHVMKSEFILLP